MVSCYDWWYRFQIPFSTQKSSTPHCSFTDRTRLNWNEIENYTLNDLQYFTIRRAFSIFVMDTKKRERKEREGRALEDKWMWGFEDDEKIWSDCDLKLSTSMRYGHRCHSVASVEEDKQQKRKSWRTKVHSSCQAFDGAVFSLLFPTAVYVKTTRKVWELGSGAIRAELSRNVEVEFISSESLKNVQFTVCHFCIHRLSAQLPTHSLPSCMQQQIEVAEKL